MRINIIKVSSKKKFKKDLNHCPEPFKAHLCKIKPEQDHVLRVCYKTRGTLPLAVQRIYFEADPGIQQNNLAGLVGV